MRPQERLVQLNVIPVNNWKRRPLSHEQKFRYHRRGQAVHLRIVAQLAVLVLAPAIGRPLPQCAHVVESPVDGLEPQAGVHGRRRVAIGRAAVAELAVQVPTPAVGLALVRQGTGGRVVRLNFFERVPAKNRHWFETIDTTFYILFFTASAFTMSLALTPTTFIAILSGFFFKWSGLPGVIISYLGAMAAGFYIGKILNIWFVGGFISEDEKLKDFFQRLKQNSFMMVIFGRLSPLLPFAMMNIAFSSIKVNWGSYLGGSLIGMLPRTLVFFYTGTKVTEIWSFLKRPTLEGFWSMVPLALIIISTAGIVWLIRKSMKPGN